MYLGQADPDVVNALLAQLPSDTAAALRQPEVAPYVSELVGAAQQAAAPYVLPIAAQIAAAKVEQYWMVAAGAALAIGLYVAARKRPRRGRR